MKKKVTLLLLLALSIWATAQTENPRGIYKMTTLTGKAGEVKAPYNQYKICTDSLTLMVTESATIFRIMDNDRQVFNYTGSQPKSEDDKSPLIYDSSDRQFKLKWWSTYTNHLHFPKDGWCIEKYESGVFSDRGKTFFDALTGAVEASAKNRLIGTWRVIGEVDELRYVKKALPSLHEKYAKSRHFNHFMVFTPNSLTTIYPRGGETEKIECTGKKSYTYKSTNSTWTVKWLSKNRIAIADTSVDYRRDWMILERVTDGTTPLGNIARQYVRR